MPVVEAVAHVPVSADVAFAVSQTTGEVRLRWDRFIRRQTFVGAGTVAAKGVRTLTVQRSGLRMVSERTGRPRPSA